MQHINTLFIGHRHISLITIDSTNNYALQLLKNEQPPEGTLITAQQQTAGRGQRGNAWQGEGNKNVAMSIILRPTFLPIHRQFALSQTIALGVYNAINEILGIKVRIKWPNDIYVGDKKIGGILIENNVNQHTWLAAVVGIGININQIDFPDHLPNPTSLALESGREWDINDLTKKLCHNIERQYLQLRADKLTDIHQQYCQNLYRYGETARFETPDGLVLIGKIIGVTEQGMLLIETKSEQGLVVVYEFDLKEIQFI